jgi:hypothetical protein
VEERGDTCHTRQHPYLKTWLTVYVSPEVRLVRVVVRVLFDRRVGEYFSSLHSF